MNKFSKRICKNLRTLENALILGQGFGQLENFLSIFQTVFLIDEILPTIKSRNLVYREDFQDFGAVCNISAVIVDLNNLKNLEKTIPVISKYYPAFLIEGGEVLDQNLAGVLLSNGYVPVERQELYHIWKPRT